MPRRKTVQPLPLQIIESDEFLVEVRDRSTALIGRGLHARDDFNETLNEILDLIMPEAFIETSDAIRHYREPPCLKNAAAFARYCELKGIDRESGALRKRYFRAVKDWLGTIRSAMQPATFPSHGILALATKSQNQTDAA
jgi:hypothetical protein